MKSKKLKSKKILGQKQRRILILALILSVGIFTYFFVHADSAEARCHANPRNCPPLGGDSGGSEPRQTDSDGCIPNTRGRNCPGDNNEPTIKAPGIKRCERDDIRNTQQCKKAYRKCNTVPRPSPDRVALCKKNVIVGQKKSGSAAAPGIKRCERDDIRNTQQCKKAYRKCNKGSRPGDVIADCKIDAIKRFKKQGSTTDAPAIGEVGDYICGTFKDEKRNVHTKFDFGCIGTEFAKTGKGQKNLSPIHDLAFAFVRFMSVGVGIVIAISVIMSGIQYSMSEGNAEVTQKAKSRIRSSILGLAIYIFAFSMLQFLIPGGVFKPGIWTDESILQLIPEISIWIF